MIWDTVFSSFLKYLRNTVDKSKPEGLRDVSQYLKFFTTRIS